MVKENKYLCDGNCGSVVSWGLGGDPFGGFMQGYNIGALNHNGAGTSDSPYELDELVVTANGPRSWEYFVPIWGSARSATYAFSQGRYADAAASTLMLTAEVF